MITFQ